MRTGGNAALLLAWWLILCCATTNSCFLTSWPTRSKLFQRSSSSYSPRRRWSCGAGAISSSSSSISSATYGADHGHCSKPPRQHGGAEKSGESITTGTPTFVAARKELDRLLLQAGLLADQRGGIGNDAKVVQMSELLSEGAFCNQVYRIRVEHQPSLVGGNSSRKNRHDPTAHLFGESSNGETNPSTCLVAKIFSNLSLTRRDPLTLPPMGELDRLVAHHGLAPRVIASTNCGILTEQCLGRPLREADVHAHENTPLSQQVGNALSRLHSIHIDDAQHPSGMPSHKSETLSTSCLWYACDKMLDMSDPHFHHHGWSIQRFRKELERQRALLDVRHQLPLVELGHGDCKPANVFVTSDGNDANEQAINRKYGVQLIDLELAGPHYRAFDLAKFFRTGSPTRYGHINQRTMLRSYLDSSSASGSTTQSSLDELEREVNLVCPLTWLEAAIFFVCRASSASDSTRQDNTSPTNHQLWKELMEHRLEGYQSSICNQ